ncbi:Arginine kinase [Orchesella cincta]|uniref:Arginine kinase n=1 Tax=Orchesella cincta TaxID=48709 RepID=A0A1D2MVW0_ORCCI|nr:Arginine kinase [Orchesella cincta]
MVLKGHGHELTTKTSENPEIQEFLNNVPAYMAKINSIHSAAYTGNMRDLQSLLDRKRLAEAQDSRGRGPLHHAVLGNAPQVVRYLVNGYPHCLNLMDHNNRTALHYAATLPDSGAMYKVLIQAGGDPNVRDSQGNTPGIYLRRKDLLKMAELVGSGTPAPSATKSKAVDTWERPATPYPETQSTVIHISPPASPPGEQEQEQMELPVSNLSLLNSFYLEVLSKESQSIWSKTWKKLTSGNNSTEVANKYVKRYLTPQVFHKVKMRCTPRYASTLLDCIKFYPQFFIVAPDPHAYTSFSEVFLPAIFDANGVKPFTSHPDMVLQGATALSQDYPIVDLPSKFVQLVRVRVSRNIRPFAFIPIMKREHLYEIQKLIRRVFESEQFEWFDLETLEKDERDEVVENRSVWFPEATKISRFWPKGRGFLANESGSTHIWVNAEDHVDVVVQSQYGNLRPVMEVVQSTIDMVQEHCDFHFNSQCGFLTVDPFRCGTGLKITFRVRLPNLMQNRSYFTQRCETLNLSLKWKQKYKYFGSSSEVSPEDWVEVENIKTCGVNENEIVDHVISSVTELIKDEEDKARAIDRATTKKKEHGTPTSDS